MHAGIKVNPRGPHVIRSICASLNHEEAKTHYLIDTKRYKSFCEHIEAETKCRHLPDDIFKRIFLNENSRIPIEISLKFVPWGPINNIPALVQIMAWRRTGDEPLSESMMVRLPTHIYTSLSLNELDVIPSSSTGLPSVRSRDITKTKADYC